MVSRKDQDFNDIHEYLTVMYPNVLVPNVEKRQQQKKFSDEYLKSRPVELKRFLDQCLRSETIKQDKLFELFLDVGDPQIYKKESQKLLSKKEIINNLEFITPLNVEPLGF